MTQTRPLLRLLFHFKVIFFSESTNGPLPFLPVSLPVGKLNLLHLLPQQHHCFKDDGDFLWGLIPMQLESQGILKEWQQLTLDSIVQGTGPLCSKRVLIFSSSSQSWLSLHIRGQQKFSNFLSITESNWSQKPSPLLGLLLLFVQHGSYDMVTQTHIHTERGIHIDTHLRFII